MGKYLLKLMSLTVTLSIWYATTAFRSDALCVYYIYLSGDQNDCTNYFVAAAQPGPCPGNNRLCWFRVCDVNDDGIIDCTDFAVTFATLDSDSDSSLDDEAEIPGILEKKV